MKKNEKREKQFHSLEDIEAVLGKRLGNRNRQQKGAQERGRSARQTAGGKAGAGRRVHTGRAMRNGRHLPLSQSGRFSAFLEEYGRLFVIPLIALLLLAVILLLGRGESGKLEPESSTPAASMESGGAQPATASEPSLKTCEIPEIQLLISDYFQAKTDGDAARLYELFGKREDGQFAAIQKKLDAQRSWIQSFDDVQIYELPGMSADARLILVTYSINFRRTDTLAPGIMYCYVQKNAEGQYVLADQLRKDALDYIDEQLKAPLVEQLMTSVNNRLSNALNQDSTLALIYTSFVNGEIYSETDLDADAEQQVDLFLNPEDSYLVDDNGEAGAAAGGQSGNAAAESTAETEDPLEAGMESEAESVLSGETTGAAGADTGAASDEPATEAAETTAAGDLGISITQ